MTNQKLEAAPRLIDSLVQRTIAEELRHYKSIDLTIPAQRATADEVRARLGLPPLSPLGKVAAEGASEPRICAAPVISGEIPSADDFDGSGIAISEHIEITRGNVTDGGK